MFSLFGDKITEFLRSHDTAVIASVDSDGQPYTSTIYYVLSGDEIYFITKNQTEKYKNLKMNHRSALTVYDSHSPVALNAIGTVAEVPTTSKKDEIMQAVFKLSYDKLHDYAPIIKLHKGSFSVFKFIPHKAKLTDFSAPMGKVKEELKNYQTE